MVEDVSLLTDREWSLHEYISTQALLTLTEWAAVTSRKEEVWFAEQTQSTHPNTPTNLFKILTTLQIWLHQHGPA